MYYGARPGHFSIICIHPRRKTLYKEACARDNEENGVQALRIYQSVKVYKCESPKRRVDTLAMAEDIKELKIV